MKKISLITVLILTIATPMLVSANRFHPVYVGSAGYGPKARLANRVRNLEQAVSELQKYVSTLEENILSANEVTTCYLKTPFDGFFWATGQTEMAARAQVLSRCERKSKGSAFCSPRKLICGQ